MKKSVSFTKFDAELNTDVCDRYNNADLTLTMKIHFKQINPAGGASSGTFHDFGNAAKPSRKIIRWKPGVWRSWKSRFAASAQKFWHGKFWLENDFATTPNFKHCYDGEKQCVCHTSLDFEERGVMYRPNVWCRFRLKVVETEADAHHTIEVVRLHPKVKWFGSHETLYDSKDTHQVKKNTDSAGKKVMQRAHVHEIGHLLGLPHVDVGKAHCPTAGDTNRKPCYGVADDDMRDVMGSGMQRRKWHAKPWREAMVRITGAGSVGDATQWEALTKRHYPRTLPEVAADDKITRRPDRGRR